MYLICNQLFHIFTIYTLITCKFFKYKSWEKMINDNCLPEYNIWIERIYEINDDLIDISLLKIKLQYCTI